MLSYLFQPTNVLGFKDFHSKDMAIDYITNLKEFQRIREVNNPYIIYNLFIVTMLFYREKLNAGLYFVYLKNKLSK